MPDLDPGFPMDPDSEKCCPLCESDDVVVLEETNAILDCMCNHCMHRWEEYK